MGSPELARLGNYRVVGLDISQSFVDMARRNRSILDLLYGKDTFVNRTLAKHYGMTEPKGSDDWIHVEDAQRYGRGGLLPMAVGMVAWIWPVFRSSRTSVWLALSSARSTRTVLT
jgi:hypothetical protein